VKNTLSPDVVMEGNNIDRLENNVGYITENDLEDLLEGLYILSTEKGANEGVAELDTGGKVPTSQLPDEVLGNLSYKGNWDAANNSPELSDGSGEEGDFYVVNVDGDTELDGISVWGSGDWAIFHDGGWIRFNNTLPSDVIRQNDNISDLNNDTGFITSSDIPVTSVAGKVGDVELELADIVDFNSEDFIPSTEKGANEGVAELDTGGKVPTSQLPNEVLNNLRYSGEWDADQNSPELEDSVGDEGQFFIVSVDGSTELNGVDEWREGDWVVRLGGSWKRLINSENPNAVLKGGDISD